MINISVELRMDTKDRMILEKILVDVVKELLRGDAKYGHHRSHLRAYGVLRAELAELKTELDCMVSADDIRKEAVQVAAMALKLIRDICDG